MYILSLLDKSDQGAFAIVDSDGDKILVLFEEYDDAERYLGLLEADDYPEMEVIEVKDQRAYRDWETDRKSVV